MEHRVVVGGGTDSWRKGPAFKMRWVNATLVAACVLLAIFDAYRLGVARGCGQLFENSGAVTMANARSANPKL